MVLIEDSGQPETSADKPQEHPSSEGECDVGETSYKHLPYVKRYGVTLHASRALDAATNKFENYEKAR